MDQTNSLTTQQSCSSKNADTLTKITKCMKLVEDSFVNFTRVKEALDQMRAEISAQNDAPPPWQLAVDELSEAVREITAKMTMFDEMKQMVEALKKSDEEMKDRVKLLETQVVQVQELLAILKQSGGDGKLGETPPPPPRPQGSTPLERGGGETCAPPPPPPVEIQNETETQAQQESPVEIKVEPPDVQECPDDTIISTAEVDLENGLDDVKLDLKEEPVSPGTVPPTPTPDSILSSTQEKNCSATGTKKGTDKIALVEFMESLQLSAVPQVPLKPASPPPAPAEKNSGTTGTGMDSQASAVQLKRASPPPAPAEKKCGATGTVKMSKEELVAFLESQIQERDQAKFGLGYVGVPAPAPTPKNLLAQDSETSDDTDDDEDDDDEVGSSSFSGGENFDLDMTDDDDSSASPSPPPKKMKASPETTALKNPFGEKTAEKERSNAEANKGKEKVIMIIDIDDDDGASRNPGPSPARKLRKRPIGGQTTATAEAPVATAIGSVDAAAASGSRLGSGTSGNSTFPAPGGKIIPVGNEAKAKRHWSCKHCQKPFTNMTLLSKHENVCKVRHISIN